MNPASRSAPRVKAAPARQRDTSLEDRLRDAIIGGEFAPGTALRQAWLAARFDTSRMPVREALRVLEAEGLVLHERHRGVVVAPTSAAELREVYEMRVAAECLALRLALPELSNAQIDRAAALQADIERAELARFGALNKAFHLSLYSPCKRPRLLAHIGALNDLSDRYLRMTLSKLDYAPRTHAEHHALLAACRLRDEAQALTLLQAHIEEAGEALLETFEVR